MSPDAQTEPASAAQNPQSATFTQPPAGSTPAEPARPKRRINPVLIAVVLIVLLVIGLAYYLYSRGFEETDDAQVDGHLNPIAARIDGTIKAVYVDDNQQVQAGKLLVELDPRDYQVALNQVTAQADQAQAQLAVSHPSLPITRTGNRTDLATSQSELINAQSALDAAHHDYDSSVARLKESQAVNERAQADLLRYKALLDKNEVARSEYDQYKATADSQIQTVAANQSAVASAQTVIQQREAQLEEQRSKLQQTQTNAPLQVAIREADIKGQQANVEVAKSPRKSAAQSSLLPNSAPVTGVITPTQRRSRRAHLRGPAITDDRANRRSVDHRQLQRDATGPYAPRPIRSHLRRRPA